jgi:capsular exopolysaccharide synthesis family protein
MKTSHRGYSNGRSTVVQSSTAERKHLVDHFRVVYKRRWIALPVFLIFFVVGVVNALREIPVYQARAQVLIESDSPKVARLDQVFQAGGSYYDDDFLQTQFRILQSRTLAKRTLDSMKLWDAPRLGDGPIPKGSISFSGLAWSAVYGIIDLVEKPFAQTPPPAVGLAQEKVNDETVGQSGRIDDFLGGLMIMPVRNSRIVEVRYASTDPVFAAKATNALAESYIQQNTEFKFNASKDAVDWLSRRLTEQKRSVEASEAALQAYKEQNGAVSVSDSASNIVVQRLTELNSALTKAKTERINKEALYNQLKTVESAGTLDTFPAVLANDYVQKLKADLAELQRQQQQLAERYGPRHQEVIKNRAAIESADAKLKIEQSKIVDAVKNEYMTALNEENSLQAALDTQKSEALRQNRKGIEYGVLQREVDSNRQIYDSLMQRTKETGITSEQRASNVRIVDPAEVPRGPISPNVQRDLTVTFGFSLMLAVGLAFLFEYLDNRIRTPQEMKAYLDVPFLGMVPAVGNGKDGSTNPLVNGVGIPANFGEAFKTVRTNVLFSSAEAGLRTVVVTSAGPGEGKSIVAANLAIALAQAGQRVLLIDADMRRPRVHEIFGTDQEPGLSNVLTGNAKTNEAIRKSATSGLWLLHSGHIPPNPAELLGSRRYLDFIASLEEHFDWAIIDTPPVLVVADSSIAANHASGIVFVVASDKTNRHAAREAIEQLSAANARIIGSVLNRVDLVKHPYYYSAYYRKEYSKYYVSNAS